MKIIFDNEKQHDIVMKIFTEAQEGGICPDLLGLNAHCGIHFKNCWKQAIDTIVVDIKTSRLTPEQAFAEHTRLSRLYVDFPDYIQGDYEPVKAIKEDILRRIDELREIEKSALGRPSH